MKKMSWKKVKEIFLSRKFLAIATIILCIVSPILFWKSLIIWVTPAFPIAFSAYEATKYYNSWRNSFLEEVKENGYIIVAAITALVSTIIQYWSAITAPFVAVAHFIAEWALTIGGFFGVLLVIFVIIATVKMRNRKKEEKRIQKIEKDLEATRLIKRQEELKEKEERRKQALEMIEGFEKQSSVSWKDLVKVFDMDVSIPIPLVLRANFLDLIDVSDIKKQIRFTPREIEKVSASIEMAINNCFDDQLLRSARKQLSDLQKFSSYNGYDSLVKKLENRTMMMKFISQHQNCVQ